MVADLPLNQVICGDAVELMQKLPDDSIHAIVTDPPYGLEFMGEEWDKFRPNAVSPRWSSGAGFSPPGIGERQTPWPSHYSTSFFGTANPTCAACGGRLRGSKRCVCEKPKWRVKGEPVEGGDLPTFQWFTTRYAVAYYEFTLAWAREALRVLKPGASMLVMGGTRTFHRMACGVEDAGFEIKDTILWCYNSGFPKAQDLGKMIDKRLGAQREIVGEKEIDVGMQSGHMHAGRPTEVVKVPVTAPATSEAKKWNGWKVGGLKPSYEPVVWAVKPPEGSYVDNVLKHEVGAINVDGCRIPYESEEDKESARFGVETDIRGGGYGSKRPSNGFVYGRNVLSSEQGRFPANMIRTDEFHDGYDRFYFIPKADRGEREEGLESLSDGNRLTPMAGRGQEGLKCKKCGRWKHSGNPCNCLEPDFEKAKFKRPTIKNIHPTVKPIRLMEHLIKLVTREGQIVLDPFVGSGTTCIAARRLNRRYIGFDNNPEYIEIAKRRLAAIPKPLEAYSETLEVIL